MINDQYEDNITSASNEKREKVIAAEKEFDSKRTIFAEVHTADCLAVNQNYKRDVEHAIGIPVSELSFDFKALIREIEDMIKESMRLNQIPRT